MRTLLLHAALLLALVVPARADHGREYTVGSLAVRVIETVDDVSVFLWTASCDTSDARVSVRIATPEGGWRTVTKHVKFHGCTSARSERVTFPTGHGVLAIFVNELMNRAAHTLPR